MNAKFAAILGLFLVVAVTVTGQSTRRSRLKPVKDLPQAIVPIPEVAADTVTDRAAIDSIAVLSNYKKAVASRVESILVTNRSITDTLRCVHLDIDYRTPEGKQLNRRQVTINTTVPPGQTRHVSFAAWDRQQLFYHIDTPPARKTRRTSAFTVDIQPVFIVLTR